MEINTAKYLLSSKGKNLLVHDDYIFRRKSKLGGRSYWICAYDRGYRCKARLCVLDGSTPPKILTKSGSHNHEREHGRVEAREMVNSLKRQAMESNETIDQIYTSCVNTETLTNGGLVAMSNKAAVKAAMRRARIRSSRSRFCTSHQLIQNGGSSVSVERSSNNVDVTSYFRNNISERKTDETIREVSITKSRRNRRKGTPRKVIYVLEGEED